MVESQWLTNQLTPSKVVLLGKLVVAHLFRYVTQRMLVVFYRRLRNSVCTI